jgi:replicative DNA helicase
VSRAELAELNGEVDRSLFERTPPHDLAAEQKVLGGMLTSRGAIEDVIGVIASVDHHRPAHQVVHETILGLYEHGDPVDPVSVADELTRQGKLVKVGGAPYLFTLVASVPTAANAGYYARIVRLWAILRRQIEICTRGIQRSYEGELDDAEELVRGTITDLENLLAEHNPADAIEPFEALLNRTLEDLGRPMVEAPGLKTGFADLDAIFGGGLRPGWLVCIAARPGLGKSTLALDMARAMGVKRGHVVQFHSLEMSKEDLVLAMLAAEARVSSYLLRTHELKQEDWQRISDVFGRMVAAPVFVDDTEALTVGKVEARFGELTRAGHRPDVIIIDYLQLMQPSRRGENRQQEVSAMTRTLKLLGKKLRVPVVILAQLNRGPEARADKRPVPSDLRESGAVEQDSDVVILLHREDAYERESHRAGEADLIVAKNRHGATADIAVAFQGHYRRFVDMAVI